jgi:hypothetical protein
MTDMSGANENKRDWHLYVGSVKNVNVVNGDVENMNVVNGVRDIGMSIVK